MIVRNIFPDYKFLSRILLFGILFCLMPFCGFSQKLPQNWQLIHSDSVIYRKVGLQETTQVYGDVFFKKGEKEVRCSHLIYYHQTGLTVFLGQAVFIDSSRLLQADRVEYHKEPEKEVAEGNVHMIIDQKEIFAEQLQYLVDDEFVVAEKDVRFLDKENDVQLFGGKVNYYREDEIGHVFLEPKLEKLDSLGRVDICIEAKELHYDGKNKTATANDSVVITQDDVIAYCDSTRYFEDQEKVVLDGKPHVQQGNDMLSAEQIELFFENKKLRKAHLIRSGTMISKLFIDDQPAEDKITGQEIWIDIRNDSLRHIQVSNQAISVYHIVEDNEVQGVNQLMGDEIELIFEQGEVRYVHIRSNPGLSRGQFTPAGKKVGTLNWIQ